MKNFIKNKNHDYFYEHCHKGCAEKIESLAKLPFFDDVYKHYKEFADNNRIAYLEKATDYIIDKMKLKLSDSERSNLKTYAYYCGKYYDNVKDNEKIEKFNSDGFYVIESDEKLHGEKVEFIIDSSSVMFGGITKLIGKLHWSPVDKRLMVMKPRCRRRGFWVDGCDGNVYIKLLKK
tara:strand:+ start:53 stop:583 length:531 start_codon:yes stop_codon:yes gene_type:complete